MIPIHPKESRPPEKIINLNGNEYKFWLIDKADEMLHSRYMIAEIQELYIRTGVSEDFLKEIAEMLCDIATSNKDLKAIKNDIFTIGQNLKGRVGMIAERTMYEEMACVYYLMDDEPMEYIKSWQERKKEVWEASGERDFFIEGAFRLINDLPNISIKDIFHVLQGVSERLEQLPMLKNL